jgi:hypothetical protein
MFWLMNLAMFPFLEAGDDSAEALDGLSRAVFAVGFLDETKCNRYWLANALKMSSPTTALELKIKRNKTLQDEAGWHFTGWLRWTKGLRWSSARFLALAFLNYWAWREEHGTATGPFGLNKADLDHYLAKSCRSFFGFEGIPLSSTLQAFHYFTEYLVAQDYFGVADAAALQSAAADLYEAALSHLSATDPVRRICPAYAALIEAPF